MMMVVGYLTENCASFFILIDDLDTGAVSQGFEAFDDQAFIRIEPLSHFHVIAGFDAQLKPPFQGDPPLDDVNSFTSAPVQDDIFGDDDHIRFLLDDDVGAHEHPGRQEPFRIGDLDFHSCLSRFLSKHRSATDDLARKVSVVLLRSPRLHPRTLIRYDVVAEVLGSAGIEHRTVGGSGESALSQMMSLVLLGDWISYYLAILSGTDPSPVKVIDHLKKRLAEV